MRHEDADKIRIGGLDRLDRLLEHRSRLGACALLAQHDALSFSRLKELLDETDGNLGAHLRRLEDQGYVTVRKEFRDRRPVSWYSLTSKGREALQAHLNAMAELGRGLGFKKRS